MNRFHWSFLFLLLIFLACQSTPDSKQVTVKDSLLDLVQTQNTAKIRDVFGLDTDINAVNDQGQSALHLAAMKDLSDITAVLIARGAAIDKPDKYGKTPLHYAVERGSTKSIPLLVKAGASTFKSDKEGRSPLSIAISQAPDLVSILANVDNVRAKDDQGNTVLHMAGELGLVSLVDYLLSLNPDVTARNLQGLTALDMALNHIKSESHAESAWKLIQKGSPRPNDKNFMYYWQAGAAGNPQMSFELGNTSLHYAASRGHLGILMFLIPQFTQVDCKDIPGNTPFHRAIENAQFDAATLLLKNKADINATDFNKNSALHLALTSQKPEEGLSFLLQNGASSNIKNNFGNTPLHLVISLNLSPSLVLLLINQKSDVEARNKLGNTPLLEAVKEKNKVIIGDLLAAGANPFAINNQDDSPLSIAVKMGTETLSMLISDKNVNQRDDQGNTALHQVVSLGDYPKAVLYLLSLGANPNERNKWGMTPLHLSINRQSLAVAQLLVKNDGDLYIADNIGTTPLMLAFKSQPLFIDQFFNGDVLEKIDSSKNTPIFHAIFLNNLPVIQVMVKKGASLKVQNLSGSTPLHEAVKSGNYAVVDYLLKSGASVSAIDNLGNTPLHNLVYWDSIEIGELLISYGASIDPQNKEGRTPLHEAVKRNQTNMTDFFLIKKANPNSMDNAHRPILFDAVSTGNLELIKALIQSGAILSQRDQNGNTILHLATILGSKSIIEYCLNQGTDIFAENKDSQTPVNLALKGNAETLRTFFTPKIINLQNNQGQSVLHLAVLQNVPASVVQYLLNSGIDIKIRDRNGKTALDLAEQDKKSELIQVLKNRIAG